MIKIDENYWITPDAYCWVLNREEEGEFNEKTGKITIIKDKWYYPSIERCLAKYANEVPKTSSNYEELLRVLAQVAKVIKEVPSLNRKEFLKNK